MVVVGGLTGARIAGGARPPVQLKGPFGEHPLCAGRSFGIPLTRLETILQTRKLRLRCSLRNLSKGKSAERLAPLLPKSVVFEGTVSPLPSRSSELMGGRLLPPLALLCIHSCLLFPSQEGPGVLDTGVGGWGVRLGWGVEEERGQGLGRGARGERCRVSGHRFQGCNGQWGVSPTLEGRSAPAERGASGRRAWGAAGRGRCGGHRRAGCHGDGAARAPSLALARGGAGQRAARRRAGQAAALRGSPAAAGLALGPEGERDPAKGRALGAHAPRPLPPGPGLDPYSAEVGTRETNPTPGDAHLQPGRRGPLCPPQSRREWAAWRVSEPGAGAEGGLGVGVGQVLTQEQ